MLTATSPSVANAQFDKMGSPFQSPSAPAPSPAAAMMSTPTRKLLEPKELPFLQESKPIPRTVPTVSTMTPAMMRASPSTPVGRGILKFDSPSAVSLVERRKQQLEKKWTEIKRIHHVKKTKWGMCQKAGVYKKKVVVEPVAMVDKADNFAPSVLVNDSN